MKSYWGWGLILFIFAGSLPAWAMGKRPAAPQETEMPQPTPKIVLDLEDSYIRALQRSETIAIEKEEIAKVRAAWLEATGTFIGDGDFVITDFRQEKQNSSTGEGGVGGTFTAAERRERRFVFSQPIFQGFRSFGALTGAGNLGKQRQGEYQRAKELLFLEVVQAFYGVLQQRKDVETIEGIHQLFEERIGELTDRENVGRSRTGEVVTARSRMRILEAELANSRRLLALAESLMEFYTGVPSEQAVYEDEELSEDAIVKPENYELLAENRADVEAARQASVVARKAVVVAQSDLWPEVSVDATHYEKREGFQSGIDWDVLFTVNVPLYRGGTTLGAVKRKYSEWKQSKLSYSLVKRQAELEIKDTYQNWIAGLEQNRAYQSAVKASQENYRYQKEDYGSNLVNNLDVLAALESLFTTSRDANRVYYGMKQAYWDYQTAIGQCCQDLSS